MTLRFSDAAAIELQLASDHYEGRQAGLGDQFIDAVAETARQISEWPMAGRPFDEIARGRIVRRFPYWLVYEQRGSGVVVTAVAHNSRGDDYRRSRWDVREARRDYRAEAA